MEDDDDKYQRYANIPIPSYDEAIASDSASSRTLRGPGEISDDAERQNLLSQNSDGRRYRQPTAESARSSEDTLDGVRIPGEHGDDDRQQIEELDYLDPSAPDTSRRSPRLYHRARLRLGGARKWSQGFSNLSATLSSIRIPSFRSLYTPISSSDSAPTRTTTEVPTTRLGRLRQHLHIPDHYRPSLPTAARICGLLALLGLVYILFILDIFPGSHRLQSGTHFDPESVRAYVQEHISGENIEIFLAHVTSFDHVAGTEGDLYLAKWIEELWVEGGELDEVALRPYYVYLNYPGKREVGIVGSKGGLEWTAGLEEELVYGDGRQQTLVWHAMSRSGEVEGPLVYANNGREEDFAWLSDQGIVTKGSIALVKASGGDFASKVSAAEQAGCIGVLTYSDPSDVPSDSVWQATQDMVQRGSVAMSNYVIGDPLTPGFASTLDSNRVIKDGNPGLPNIPSLPLSWRDASVLINALADQGTKVPKKWIHGPLDFSKVWWTGNASSSSSSPIIHLKNLNEENPLQQIWNVHATIEGLESPEKKIFVGNHRDAFCFSAVDPGSGSAVLMEVVRIFNELRKLGWRPLRTIEFVSWDAGAYNAVGSTEYVEDHIEALRNDGIAYLNVGSGVSGSTFRSGGSPVWQKALLHVLGRVSDPGGNSTLKQLWDQHGSQLSPLPHNEDGGGDHIPFQSLAGASTIDFGFVAGGAAPDRATSENSYPHHSCHETFEWMTEFGDPGFHYHRTLAQIWALLILEIADRPLIPFDLPLYVSKLHEWITTLERDAVGIYAKLAGLPRASANDMTAATNFSVQPLQHAADNLAEDIEVFGRFEDLWTRQVLGGAESTQFALARLSYNDRIAHFETDLLDLQFSYTQFKHVVFGPQLKGGEGEFPGVRDKVAVGDWTGAGEMVDRAVVRILAAGKGLVTL